MTGPGLVVRAPVLSKLLADAAASGAAVPRDRARGAMLGLAAGNLLGLPVEGVRHDEIARRHPAGVTDIDPAESSGPMDDDLAQAVALAEALAEGGDPARAFAARLVSWLRSNGRGCGATTRAAVVRLADGVPPPTAARLAFEEGGGIASNGGVMRCAPVAVARARDPAALVRDSAATCAATHYAPACQWSCVVFNAVIARLLLGAAPDPGAVLAAARADGAPGFLETARADGIPAEIFRAFDRAAAPPAGISWLRRDQKLIGHALLALQAGLWAAVAPLGLEEALVAVVGAGGDADTNAAVAGAVLGARHGAAAVPRRWRDRLPERARIEAAADALVAPATGSSS